MSSPNLFRSTRLVRAFTPSYSSDWLLRLQPLRHCIHHAFSYDNGVYPCMWPREMVSHQEPGPVACVPIIPLAGKKAFHLGRQPLTGTNPEVDIPALQMAMESPSFSLHNNTFTIALQKPRRVEYAMSSRATRLSCHGEFQGASAVTCSGASCVRRHSVIRQS
jgi:hypothetical protein